MKTIKCRGCGHFFTGDACPECGLLVESPKPRIPESDTLPTLIELAEREARQHRWVERGCPTSEESRRKMYDYASRRKPSAREHWHRVLKTPGLPPLSYQYAEQALNQLNGGFDRDEQGPE